MDYVLSLFYPLFAAYYTKVQARDFKNIIFDLGGVIINLDEQKTIRAFAQLSSLPEDTIEKSILQFKEYHLFEKGLIPPDQFRNALRDKFQIEASDDEIDQCMNAMLLDIPVQRIKLIKSLNQQAIFLLSNTNQIHYTRFNQIFTATTGEENLNDCFKKAYYSHLVKMRKPDREIYECILRENDLQATETLFLDDNLTNLEGAQSIGISTFHVKHPSQLFQLFQ